MAAPEQMVRDLKSRTAALLRQKRIRREQLAYESGVTYSWLCKFLTGDCGNPRVSTLEKLARRVTELERCG
jgi:transcriptional regulator with XRE-family HTH domain